MLPLILLLSRDFQTESVPKFEGFSGAEGSLLIGGRVSSRRRTGVFELAARGGLRRVTRVDPMTIAAESDDSKKILSRLPLATTSRWSTDF